MTLYYISGIENGAGEHNPFTTTAFRTKKKAEEAMENMKDEEEAPNCPRYLELNIFKKELE